MDRVPPDLARQPEGMVEIGKDDLLEPFAGDRVVETSRQEITNVMDGKDTVPMGDGGSVGGPVPDIGGVELAEIYANAGYYIVGGVAIAVGAAALIAGFRGVLGLRPIPKSSSFAQTQAA